MHLKKEHKLNYITSEIQNLITLKNHSEANLGVITKYYSLVLTAFFAYIVFYTSMRSETKIIYSIIGLCFTFFTTASTYYTTYTIIKNLKRRLIYRKEITSLRNVANRIMNNEYKDLTVCSLDHKKLTFTTFDNLPTIAIMIGAGAPLISFLFIKDLFITHFGLVKAYQMTFSICFVITLGVLALILNLYTVHRKEFLIVERINNKKSESTIIDSINRKNNITKSKKEFKNYKYKIITLSGILIFVIFFKLFIYQDLEKWNWDINTIEFILFSVVVLYLVKRNRFLNMIKDKKN